MTVKDLLAETLAASRKDQQTVTVHSAALNPLPDGMRVRRPELHVDDRGSLFEIYRTSWKWDDVPIEHLYCFTIRPGVVKGWSLHKEHDDRYFLISGEMQVVLYDVRADSSTYGKVMSILMTEQDRKLVSIPAYVWHADFNVGDKDSIGLNMPTKAYDHANPDKYRLPIDTPLIPHRFPTTRGW